MRGTPACSPRTRSRTGIIPACAGNTPRRHGRWRRDRDHPRVCGEHDEASAKTLLKSGSSPRVRGTLFQPTSGRPDPGIIPACAGNTVRRTPATAEPGDHPRVCGEHLLALINQALTMGSSPRVRGTPTTTAGATGRPGIIPACAGNTRCRLPRAARWWDHPRVCGEHQNFRMRSVGCAGSSPRVRGTPWCVRVRGDGVGIIPACAGNTE